MIDFLFHFSLSFEWFKRFLWAHYTNAFVHAWQENEQNRFVQNMNERSSSSSMMIFRIWRKPIEIWMRLCVCFLTQKTFELAKNRMKNSFVDRFVCFVWVYGMQVYFIKYLINIIYPRKLFLIEFFLWMRFFLSIFNLDEKNCLTSLNLHLYRIHSMKPNCRTHPAWVVYFVLDLCCVHRSHPDCEHYYWGD